MRFVEIKGLMICDSMVCYDILLDLNKTPPLTVEFQTFQSKIIIKKNKQSLPLTCNANIYLLE